MLDCRGGGISTGITLGIAGSARQGQGLKLMDLHKCPSGEDIEEESVEATADLHFDDLVKVYTGQLIPRDGTLYRSSPSTTTLLSAMTFRGLCSSSRTPRYPGIERRALSTHSP